MHNFGRGMWRRISDHEKQQQASDVQTNRLTHYLQTQKQRAIDAYSRIAISNEKKEVKEKVVTNEVTTTDVTDNYVFVEAVISEATVSEATVISEATVSEVTVSEVTVSEVTVSEVTVSEAKEEPSVLSEAKPSVLSEAKVETSVLSEAEPVVNAPISKSNAKKKRKNKEKI